MSILNESYTLNNGIKIPKIGFGTAPLKGEEAYSAINAAINSGYRHIDTAQNYENEVEVAKAIKDSSLNREDFFITTKLRAEIKTYDEAINAFEASLKALDTDYIDLFLIHAPWPWNEKYSDYSKENIEVYKALEHLYKEKRVRAIGVSNFDTKDLKNILNHCAIKPQINQIKYHIGHPQVETVRFCERNDILVEAYSPLGRGGTLSDPTITSLAEKYKVSAAQICLNYILHKAILPLPRSSKVKNIEANKAVDFKITNEDIKTLDSLNIETIEFGKRADQLQ